MRADRLIVCWLTAVVLLGCATRPINEPITQVDLKSGYRPHLKIPKIPDNDPQTLFVLSFSGGGTRAAAFSYGVLEELRRTEIVVDGQRRRLIDEVDLMTGVSGGSFTALAYALYGDRLFAEYEAALPQAQRAGHASHAHDEPVQLAEVHRRAGGAL